MANHSTTSHASWLPIIRELYTGLIAVLVLGLFLKMVLDALGSVMNTQSFGPIKELLAIVNPAVGLIIGYYFSRVTSEARAEKAETAAAESSQTASDARHAQARAEQEARTVREQAAPTRQALDELTRAVDAMPHEASDRPEAAGPERHLALANANARIAAALERAQQVLGR